VTRALTVVLIAVLIASAFGINNTSLARERQVPQASDVQQRDTQTRANRIGINHVVRIERMDGTKFNALLEGVTADAITVVLLDTRDRRRETIRFTDIRKIDEVRGRALRNILIGVGIGAAVLVGACAVAVRSSEDRRAAASQSQRPPLP
jgi:flagellar basal body-associated protein FliL